jgi:hypothetical protein
MTDSLKQKFNKLCRKPAPTSNPNVPEDIGLAEQIQQKLVDLLMLLLKAMVVAFLLVLVLALMLMLMLMLLLV